MAFLSEDLKSNYAGLYETRTGFGKSAAVLSIDFIDFYTVPGAPFYGQGVVDAVVQSAPLYAAARTAGIPVIYTNVLYDKTASQGGMFVRKVPALRRFVADEPLTRFDARIAPEPDDLVITKHHSSAFFGTPLSTMLRAMGHDTVIITGCSTSGCVRATAVDAVSNGFHVIVPAECAGDRHQAPHDAALFDINAKYGDVMPVGEVLQYINGVRA
ncbi:isochorismatase family protein [Alcaligenaceae bacterium A4P071]|nr:isochorismatase family protein [Alcaligenaceae bacterium B3P038]MDQ2147734.1 isochorismatase family protein [Alcaligenaceae bacterium C4P045]MDQ2185063.1 isochorismatase family protein [Alcaligenaceae bacterium A4P071]